MDWSERLDAMTAGYRNSMILVSALKVGIFEAFGKTARLPGEIAAELSLDPRATDTVIRALAAAEVLVRRGDRFAVEPALVPFLLADSPQTRQRDCQEYHVRPVHDPSPSSSDSLRNPHT